MAEKSVIYANPATKSKGKAIVTYDTPFGNTEKVAEAPATL
jgi:hypothetical protein